ncbi:relaxase/mobilization nuclease domain-containing protein, partial [Macrococcoides caseolyticum]|uniref:relaxase/mobilization nuclease domain-containing protein n=1 Tax=Macrococcoides caseolyticum TaxID=69966 RepID=UPI0030EDB193
MAQTKVASSKSATASIKYGRDGKDKETSKKKCIAMSGINCDPSNAEYEFGVVRKALNKAKDEGQDIQAHLIEQSFKGRDIDPFEVNQMGYELAERLNKELGGGFQAVVYTHGNTNNYHNHIVFNAVNLEDGHKYHCYQEKKIVERINDAIVKEHGYPVIEKNKERGTSVTIKEQKLKDKGEYVWKDDLRARIDQAFEKTKDSLHFDLERFKAHLTDLGVNIRE